MVAVVVVVPYPAKKQINIDIFPLVGYLKGEREGRGGEKREGECLVGGRGPRGLRTEDGGGRGVQRASRGEGVARFPPPRPNWKNGNNKSRLLGGLHGGLHERPKGLQRGAEKRGEGREGGGASWQSRWDGDGVGGCAQCSMRPGPNRLIGNTHRSRVLRVREGSLTCVPSLAAAAATAAAAAKARKVGLGVEDREREGEEGEEGDTYLDGHVETNMATSSKDRYTFRT